MTKRIGIAGLVGLVAAMVSGCASEPRIGSDSQEVIPWIEPAGLPPLWNPPAPEPEPGPYQQLGTVSILHTILAADGTPLPALLVKACAPGDRRCDYPLTIGTTDEHGVVTLEVSKDFDGSYQVSGINRENALIQLAPYAVDMAIETRLRE